MNADRTPLAPTAPAEFARDEAPIIATTDIPVCPVCDHPHFSPAPSGFDYELRTCANHWRFVKCARCSHLWLTPRPAIEALSAIYPKHYYAYRYTEAVPSVALRIKNALDRRKYRFIARALGRPAGSFCDVGCGDGRYLSFASSAGVPASCCLGLELDQATVDRLRSKGFRAFNSRVEDCDSIPDASLDIITLFHVIEHVDNPRAVVQRLTNWLAPGAVLAIETPNFDSFDARLFRRTYWGGYHFPRHWNLFNPASLRRLLESAGLNVQSTQFLSGHSFWLYSLHHTLRYAARPGPFRLALSRAFDPFAGPIALPALGAFTAFDTIRASLGCRTSSMLMLARRPPGSH